MRPVVAIPFRGTREDAQTVPVKLPPTESFYHLSDCLLSELPCQGTACFVARHPNASSQPDIREQTPRVYCLGQCFVAPSTSADRTLRPRVEVHSRNGIVLGRLKEHGGARTLEDYRKYGGYQGLKKALKSKPDRIIQELQTSELRGRGGAAFPTGKKWHAVFNQSDSQKYVVANGDEGDPGAYIDRFLMEDDPFALIEGMTVAAFAVGANKGFIYLRAEYPYAETSLENALKEAREAHLLGEKILGHDFSFDIKIVIGHGSYICGEETAMLNSIEGRRPEARTRPPFSSTQGLWAHPTLVNNVETFANVPWIAEHGGEAYQTMGFSKSRGTKGVSLNSLFNRPGLYEIEFGVTVRHIVEKLGGGLRGDAELKGVLIGGPLAGIIPPRLLDTPFGFEELRTIGASVGHGGVVAFDERTSIAELMHHVFSFGAYESCGKCTPCRLGSRQIERMFHSNSQKTRSLKDYERIVSALKSTSLCGLGTGLAEFAESVKRHYGTELKSCLK